MKPDCPEKEVVIPPDKQTSLILMCDGNKHRGGAPSPCAPQGYPSMENGTPILLSASSKGTKLEVTEEDPLIKWGIILQAL